MSSTMILYCIVLYNDNLVRNVIYNDVVIVLYCIVHNNLVRDVIYNDIVLYCIVH